MLDIFPFFLWLAVVTSAVLLIVLFRFGDLRRRSLAIFLGWFLAAAYLQFFGGSPLAAAVGVLLQTALAVCLTLRWKLGS